MTRRPPRHWLAELYCNSHRELVRYAARLVGNREDGEEVVQSVYMRMSLRNATQGAVAEPRSYAFTATRRTAYDLAEYRNREWLYRLDLENIDSVSGGVDPAVLVEQRQQILRMVLHLNELPADCRAAYLMNKVEGYSHREIAAHLGISTSMVEKHIVRALMHCRDMLRQDGWLEV